MILQLNKGLDIGNGFSKYGNGRFESRVKVGTLNRAEIPKNNDGEPCEIHEVTFGGKQFILGHPKGAQFMGVERYYSDYYMMSLLSALALSAETYEDTRIKANIVVGLPVDDYNASADEVSAHLNNQPIHKIQVDGVDYEIEIESATVFIEGGLPIETGDDRHIITIDVGAGTINVIEWKNQDIINKFTINGAFTKLHKEIVEEINSRYKTKLTIEDIPELLNKFEADEEGKMPKEVSMNTRNGVVDIAWIQDIIKTTISNHASVIETSFGTDTADAIIVCGGGAKNTFAFWKQHFPKAEKHHKPQYANQRVYQAVANAIYNE